MAAAFPKSRSLQFVDTATGTCKNYIAREGEHPETGKPLSDIIVLSNATGTRINRETGEAETFKGTLAVNWPKVNLDGEIVAWCFFAPDLELTEGTEVNVGWDTDGHFHCNKPKVATK